MAKKRKASASIADKIETFSPEDAAKARAEFLNSAMNAGRQQKFDHVIQGSADDFVSVKSGRFSSGNLGLDIILGGGWERGRYHLIKGPYSSGKSRIAGQVVATLTRKKEAVFYLDYEGTTGPEFLRRLGADHNYFEYGTAPSAEEAYKLVEIAYMSGQYSAIILDSIATMATKGEREKDYDEASVAQLAKLTAVFCRKITSSQNEMILHGEPAAALFLINQPRRLIGMPGSYLPGGVQQTNLAHTITDLYRGPDITEGDKSEKESFGLTTYVRNEKNKGGPVGKRTTIGIITDDYEGHPRFSFYHGDEIWEYARKLDLVKQSGTWFEVPELGLRAQGSAHWKRLIMEDEAVGRYFVDSIKKSLPFPVEFDYDYVRMISDAATTIHGASSQRDAAEFVEEAGEDGSQ